VPSFVDVVPLSSYVFEAKARLNIFSPSMFVSNLCCPSSFHLFSLKSLVGFFYTEIFPRLTVKTELTPLKSLNCSFPSCLNLFG